MQKPQVGKDVDLVGLCTKLQPHQVIHYDPERNGLTILRSFLVRDRGNLAETLEQERRPNEQVRIARYDDGWRITVKSDVNGGCSSVKWGS